MAVADPADERARYLQARARATEAFWLAESLREARIAADEDAEVRYEAILRRAEGGDDAVVRAAAAQVRAQRSALRRAGDVLAASLQEMIERLVSVDADAIGFTQDADALILLVTEGRGALAERHLAVSRAEAILNALLWPRSATGEAEAEQVTT